MLRAPARGRATKGSTLSKFMIPAPTAGWNARDNITTMGPLYAVAMENFFPEEGYVRRRPGWASYNGGSASNGNFNSVFEFAKGNATKTLVGLTTTGRMYAGITTGSLPSATSSSLGGAEASAVNVNQLLVMAFDDNATAPQQWDGSSLAAVTISAGPTTTALAHVGLHKNRTYYTEYNSLKFWYTATNAIGGDLTGDSFDLAYIAKDGGYLLCTATWTNDGGDGVDDYFVAITSEGQAIVYRGSDPADASNWALVGVYRIPRPIGRRCAVNFGGDLLVITETGVVSMRGLFAEGGIFRGQADFTSIVGPAWRELSTATTQAYPGWFGVHFKALNMLVFNVPTHGTNQTGYQFVMNVTTGAWCRWDIPMGHAVEFQSQILFGYLTVTRRAQDATGLDGGAVVTSYFKQAYNPLGAPGRKKLIKRVHPQWGADQDATYYISLDADFNDSTYSTSALRSTDAWNDTLTQSDVGLNVTFQPESHGAIGTYFSVKVHHVTTGSQVGQPYTKYVGCEVAYEAGGPA